MEPWLLAKMLAPMDHFSSLVIMIVLAQTVLLFQTMWLQLIFPFKEEVLRWQEPSTLGQVSINQLIGVQLSAFWVLVPQSYYVQAAWYFNCLLLSHLISKMLVFEVNVNFLCYRRVFQEKTVNAIYIIKIMQCSSPAFIFALSNLCDFWRIVTFDFHVSRETLRLKFKKETAQAD